jgi:hypothetical protein
MELSQRRREGNLVGENIVVKDSLSLALGRRKKAVAEGEETMHPMIAV